jgi:bifunctional DNA-binding transcriptional regulator/antitoxin component of YhaV-PrlF toxin-antitoxin module
MTVVDGLPACHKAEFVFALYDRTMEPTGNLKVSERGQMSLPAATRHRWDLHDGGRVGYLDLGDAIIIVPGGVDELRTNLLASIDDETWNDAAAGFGDHDLTSQ